MTETAYDDDGPAPVTADVASKERSSQHGRKQTVKQKSLRTRWLSLRQRLDGFLLGAAMSWVLAPHQIQRRRELEHIFMLMATARLMGLPLMPPWFALRLLPYLTPNLLYWRRMTAFDRELEGVDLKHLGH